MIALVAGAQYLTKNVNLWYVKEKLKLPINKYTYLYTYSLLAYNFKPLISFLSENIIPFKLRIKFYVPVSATIILVPSLLASVFDFDYLPFFVINVASGCGFAIIDSFGEGITAEIVKFNKRIVEMENSLIDDEGLKVKDNPKEAFGNYLNLRNFLISVFVFLGSFFVEMLGTVKPFYFF